MESSEQRVGMVLAPDFACDAAGLAAAARYTGDRGLVCDRGLVSTRALVRDAAALAAARCTGDRGLVIDERGLVS